MKYLVFGAAFTLSLVNVQAQDKNISVYDIITEHKAGEINAGQAYRQMLSLFNDGNIHKCAAPIHMFAHKHKHEISVPVFSDPAEVKNRAARATYTSPSGKFEFTYQTTGADAVPMADLNTNGVPDYVEAAAEAADSSYRHQVERLGFADPIPNGTTYKIAFEDISFYGFTEPDNSGGGGPRTRIVVENDFSGFPANDDPDGDQLGALKVTVAHEFKHAIQFVQNGWAGDSDAWAEMDATLMEEVTYDVVNDYYNYLQGSGTVFSNPGDKVIPGSYEDITWALFFHERFGADFWPAVWARIENSVPDLPLLDAIDQELQSLGQSYTFALLELYSWHFASGVYSTPNFGFDESSEYPSPNAQRTLTEIDDTFSGPLTVNAFSTYFTYVDPPETQTGTVSVLVDTDDADISFAVVTFFDDNTIEFTIAEQDVDFLLVDEGWNWNEINQLGIVVVNKNTSTSGTFELRVSDSFINSTKVDDEIPNTIALRQNYPNPFNPSTVIPLSIVGFQKVRIDIYDVTGRLLQTAFNGSLSTGNHEISVNLQQYSSGVYIYQLTTDQAVLTKRMTLIK